MFIYWVLYYMYMSVVTYNAILDATMTMQQCHEAYTSDMIAITIVFFVAFIIILGLFMFVALQHKNMSRFIKEEKLQEKFQKYKQNNKGL